MTDLLRVEALLKAKMTAEIRKMQFDEMVLPKATEVPEAITKEEPARKGAPLSCLLYPAMSWRY